MRNDVPDYSLDFKDKKHKELQKIGYIIGRHIYENSPDLRLIDVLEIVTAGILEFYIERVSRTRKRLCAILGLSLDRINRLCAGFEIGNLPAPKVRTDDRKMTGGMSNFSTDFTPRPYTHTRLPIAPNRKQ